MGGWQEFLDSAKNFIEEEESQCAAVRVLGLVEKRSGVKRLHQVYAVGSLLVLYLLAGREAGFVANALLLVHPILASLDMLRGLGPNSELKDTSTVQWLSFWLLFALLSPVDAIHFTVNPENKFRIYWLFKFIVVSWLSLPWTRGAEKIYWRLLAPVYQRFGHEKIEENTPVTEG